MGRIPWEMTKKRQVLPLFRESAKWWFSRRFPGFYVKTRNSCKNAGFSRGFRNFARFFVPRGPDAPGLLKPMEFHTFFVISGALGPILRKMYFCLKMWKYRNYDFLADFRFLDQNHQFRVNAGIAKTPIIPKEYQRFWRVDGAENAKSRKFTKNHGFH